MKRGDVVIAATGSGFGGKPRPYIVVQSDHYCTALLILVGCTTFVEDTLALRPRLEPSSLNGLEQACDVMVDVPVTSPRQKIDRVIGRLIDEEMAEIDSALLLVLGLAEQR